MRSVFVLLSSYFIKILERNYVIDFHDNDCCFIKGIIYISALYFKILLSVNAHRDLQYSTVILWYNNIRESVVIETHTMNEISKTISCSGFF